MEFLHVSPSALLLLTLLQQSLGLMSDYKTCGDQACARMMSRVEALRDHHAPDCRFLSFKKGDMIDVYHKLAGKRTDLWAGSIDKQFGYFPKAAVRTDEVFVDEKREFKMVAQETDFFCMDEFGSIIESDQVFEGHDLEGQAAKSEELGNGDFDGPPETNDHNEKRSVPKDQGKAESSRSAPTGWLGDSEAGNEDQENFRSRKLALDIKANQPEEETETKVLGWIGDGLTNPFGYGETKLKDDAKNIKGNNEDGHETQTQSKPWLGGGIKNLLGFGGGDEETKDNDQNQSEKQDAEGWYGSVYSRISSLYEGAPDEGEAPGDVKSKAKEDKMSKFDQNMEIVDKTLQKQAKVLENDGHSVGQSGDEEEKGWYGSIISGVTSFYGDKTDAPVTEEVTKDGQEVITEGLSQDTVTKQEIKADQIQESQKGRSSETISAGWLDGVYDKITNLYPDNTELNKDHPITDGGTDGFGEVSPGKEAEEALKGEKLENDGLSAEEMSKQQDTSWYGSTLGRISNFYGDTTQTPQTTSRSSAMTDGHRSAVNSVASGEESDQQQTLSRSDQTPVQKDSGLTYESSKNIPDTAETKKVEKMGDQNTGRSSQSHISVEHPLESDEDGDKSEQDEEKTTGSESAGDQEDVDNSPMDSDGEKEGVSIAAMETRETRSVTQTEKEKEGADVQTGKQPEDGFDVTQVRSVGQNGSKDIFGTESDETKGVDFTQSKPVGGKGGLEGGQMENQEPEDEDLTQMETSGDLEPYKEKEGVDVAQMESQASKDNEGKETPQIISDETEEGFEVTQMEGHATQMESSGGREGADGALLESGEENNGIDLHQLEPKEKGVDVTQMESKEKDRDVKRQKEGVDVTQVESAGEKDDQNLTQIESQGKGGVYKTQIKHDGKKEGKVVNAKDSDGEKNVTQMESNGEKEGLDLAQMESKEKVGVDNSPMDSDGDIEGAQMESQEKVGVGVSPVDSDGEMEGPDLAQMESQEKGVHVSPMESDGEMEGKNFTLTDLDQSTEDVNITQKEFDETINKPNADSEQPENVIEATLKQTEISVPTSGGERAHDVSVAEVANGTGSDLTHGSVPENKSQTFRDEAMNQNATDDAGRETSTTMNVEGTYPNVRAHLSEESIQDLLSFFSNETLRWLDDKLGNSDYINNDDFAVLIGLEQTLEHLMKSRNEDDGGTKPSLQNIYGLLAMLRKEFMPFVADGSVDKTPDPNQKGCAGGICIQSQEETQEPEDIKTEISSDESNSENFMSKTSPQGQTQSKAGSLMIENQRLHGGDPTQPRSDGIFISEQVVEPEKSQIGEVLRLSSAVAVEFISSAFTFVVKSSADLKDIIHQAVMSLPDDIRPGPDLYGMPWEAVIVTSALGLLTVLLFTCRFVQSIKSRLYASRESKLGRKVAELLSEKCDVLEMLSECKRKFQILEAATQNGGLAAQKAEMDDLEATSKELQQSNAWMKSDIGRLQAQLGEQNRARKQQNEQLVQLEETLKTLEAEAQQRKSQLEQDQTTLKICEMNSERLQKKLQEAKEENVMLLESKAQLLKESDGWWERLGELEEERKMSESSHHAMMENCASKDERIQSLTKCLLEMKDWDSEEESCSDAAAGPQESPASADLRQKQKVQRLIHAAKMSADLKAVEDDKDRMFARLADEMKAKEDLQEGIEQMQNEKTAVVSESATYTGEIQKLQHKLQIMTEMYQENELKLHRMLTVEEKERSQKEQQLSRAGRKISLAAEELGSYRQRARELEEELEKTNQAYKNQIAAHEKKAHDNWLAARAADRDLADVKRENAVLRQRVTDWQFKLELMEKDLQPRDAPARLIRGERSPYGPSPLGRPPSETRPFLSPPTLMDGPPRVSPQFPMMPGSRAPPGGVAEGDRSVTHSEDGSPTWERERERRAFGPPGPDAAAGVYRRPPSAPFLRAPPPPPEAQYREKAADLSLGRNGSHNESRNRPPLMPADARPPPDVNLRVAPHPAPFPPLDPRDPAFPRRAFRPDFPPFPLPPMGLRGPLPPPGVFPRYPLPPHLAFPPMRPPADVSPEPPSRPSPPGSEQPSDHRPAHDGI